MFWPAFPWCVLKTGQKITFVRGDDAPAKSAKTALVSAALVCGGKLAGPKSFLHTLEDKDGVPQRLFSFAMDGSAQVTFRPAFAEETIDFAEFRKRFESADWCEQNPDHPIAYLRAMSDNLLALQETVRGMKPALLVRKGSRFAIIPQDADPEKSKELLALLG
jgi:hypothetical protein